MGKMARFLICFILLLSFALSYRLPVFATDSAPVTVQISSLTADVKGSGYSYRGGSKTLTLTGGNYILVGTPSVEYELKIYVSNHAKIEIRDLIAVQPNGSDFSQGNPVMEISPQKTVELTFSGDCRFRGGALSSGILMMDKTSLTLHPADENAKFSAGVYRFGGAGIAVSGEDVTATVKLNTSNLKKGYIALGGGVEGLNNAEGLAVNLGKGKLYLNDKAVSNVSRAMRFTATKTTDVYALFAEGAVSSDWFAAYGDVVTLNVDLSKNQKFERWFDSPETPVTFADSKSKQTTVTMPNYDVCVYPVLQSTGGEKLEIFNVDIRGGESDALACNAGETVEINASTFVGKKFIGWKFEGPNEVKFADASSMSTTFVMPKGDVIIVAQFEDEGIAIQVVGGKASRDRAIAGTVITVTAEPPENMVFYEWKIVSGTDSAGKKLKLANKRHQVTTFTMIDKEVKLEAVFVESPRTVTVSGGIADRTMADKGDKITLMATVGTDEIFKEWEVSYVSSSGSVTKSEKKYTDAFTTIQKEKQAITRIKAIVEKKPTYTVTVSGGLADSLEAAAGVSVTIQANVPEHHRFVSWRSDNEEVQISNPLSQTATFVMPSCDVTVTAVTEEVAPIAPYLSIECAEQSLVKGNKTIRLTAPVVESDGGEWLLPFVQMLDALEIGTYYQYNDLFLVEYGEKRLELLINACEIALNGSRDNLSYPFCRINGSEYIAAEDFARLFDLVFSFDGATLAFYQPTLHLRLEGGRAQYTKVPVGVWVSIQANTEDGKQFVGWTCSGGAVFTNAASPDTKVLLYEDATVAAVYEEMAQNVTISLPDGFSLGYTDQVPNAIDEDVSLHHTVTLEVVNRSSSGFDAMCGWLGEKAANVTIAKETIRLSEKTVYTLGKLTLDYNEPSMKNCMLVTVACDSLDSCVSAFARAPVGVVCSYTENGESGYLYLSDLDDSCDTITFCAEKPGVYYLLFDTYGIKPEIPYLSVSDMMEEDGTVQIEGVSTFLGEKADTLGIAYKEKDQSDWTILKNTGKDPYFEMKVSGLKPDTEYLVCMYAKDEGGREYFGHLHLLHTQADSFWLLSETAVMSMIGMILLAAGFVLLVYLHKKRL